MTYQPTPSFMTNPYDIEYQRLLQGVEIQQGYGATQNPSLQDTGYLLRAFSDYPELEADEAEWAYDQAIANWQNQVATNLGPYQGPNPENFRGTVPENIEAGSYAPLNLTPGAVNPQMVGPQQAPPFNWGQALTTARENPLGAAAVGAAGIWGGRKYGPRMLSRALGKNALAPGLAAQRGVTLPRMLLNTPYNAGITASSAPGQFGSRAAARIPGLGRFLNVNVAAEGQPARMVPRNFARGFVNPTTGRAAVLPGLIRGVGYPLAGELGAMGAEALVPGEGRTLETALAGASRGAGTGAALGSVIPGAGTALGAGIGAAVGGAAGTATNENAPTWARALAGQILVPIPGVGAALGANGVVGDVLSGAGDLANKVLGGIFGGDRGANDRDYLTGEGRDQTNIVLAGIRDNNRYDSDMKNTLENYYEELGKFRLNDEGRVLTPGDEGYDSRDVSPLDEAQKAAELSLMEQQLWTEQRYGRRLGKEQELLNQSFSQYAQPVYGRMVQSANDRANYLRGVAGTTDNPSIRQALMMEADIQQQSAMQTAQAFTDQARTLIPNSTLAMQQELMSQQVDESGTPYVSGPGGQPYIGYGSVYGGDGGYGGQGTDLSRSIGYSGPPVAARVGRFAPVQYG